MAFQQTYKEDGVVSEWNEAMFKMKRLHELQTELNRVKMNPLDKHMITGQWNYEVWFSSVDSLYSEGEPKYKEAEKQECRRIRSLLLQLLVVMPPYVTRNEASMGSDKKKEVLNRQYWTNFRTTLELYESKVKLYNDQHGLSTKNAENMDGHSIIR